MMSFVTTSIVNTATQSDNIENSRKISNDRFTGNL